MRRVGGGGGVIERAVVADGRIRNKKLTSYVKAAGKSGRKMRHNDVEVKRIIGMGTQESSKKV